MGEKLNLDQLTYKGIISVFYSKKYMLSINEALDIDHVRFSIVRLGTDGKEHKDFFLETKDMIWLCNEIDNGIAEERIAAASSSGNSVVYSFVAGEGGNQIMHIGSGKIDVRLDIQDRHDERSAWYVPLKMKDLYDLAFMYKLLTGLIQTQEFSYYRTLQEAFILGRRDRAEAFIQKMDEEKEKDSLQGIIDNFSVTFQGEPVAKDKFISVKGIDANENIDVIVLFKPDNEFTEDKIRNYILEYQTKNLKCAMKGEKRGKYILFHEKICY